MTKAFDLIHAGLRDALAFAKGKADKSKYRVHVPDKVDVKALRVSMGLTQEEFAQHYLFTAARVKDWEQGRSTPDGATRAYLTVIERNRKAVDQALQGGVAPRGGESRLRRARRKSGSGQMIGAIAGKKSGGHKNAD
jgi:putative transcriptional regulator